MSSNLVVISEVINELPIKSVKTNHGSLLNNYDLAVMLIKELEKRNLHINQIIEVD